MFESLFFPWFSAQSSLQAVIGNRLYPGHAPDAVARPYVVWHLVTVESDHTHDGPAFRTSRIQFSVFADTFTAAAGVRDVLLALLDGKRLNIAGLNEVTTFLDGLVTLWERETKTHHLAIDFAVTHSV